MLKSFTKSLASKEIKSKLLFTFFIILIYRFGSAIPIPFVDQTYVANIINQSAGFLGYLDVMSGGGLSSATIFAMSIGPYINSSIIIQLLTVAIPALEKLQKEGEHGRKKINKITRYLTVFLAIFQGLGYYGLLRTNNAIIYTNGFDGIFCLIVILTTLATGTAFIVWLGERVTEKGIGNGISIILFAGIVSRTPSAVVSLWHMLKQGLEGQRKYLVYAPAIVLVSLGITVLIVLMHLAERQIPIRYSKRIIGRKMYMGQSAHIPIKISMSGVMPIIFASSILGMPSMLTIFFHPEPGSFLMKVLNIFRMDSWTYAVMYFILIIAFNFFYVSIQYNPIEIANNLRKSSGAIPGIRPGRPTSQYISKVLWRMAMIGALAIAFIAVFPMVFSNLTHENVALGGSSLLIVVGVALETVRVIESQVIVQKNKGFLD